MIWKQIFRRQNESSWFGEALIIIYLIQSPIKSVSDIRLMQIYYDFTSNESIRSFILFPFGLFDVCLINNL